MGDLIEGTLADLHTLMAHPAGLRRGNSQLLTPASPGAGASYSYPVNSAWWERILTVSATLTTAAGGAARIPVLNYLSADGAILNQVPLGGPVPASTTQAFYADITPTSPIGAAVSSGGNSGHVTGPGATASIATTSTLTGLYTVTTTVYVDGTTTAADGDNMALSNGSTVINLIYPGTAIFPVTTQFQLVQNAATITVRSIAAGGAAAVYHAQIAYTQIANGPGFAVQAQLPDIILKPTWQLQLTASNLAAGDQFSGITIYTERYPSNWADGALGSDIEQALRAYWERAEYAP